MNQSFVHLHLHSEYSLVDSIIQIDDLIEAAVQAKISAIAITDVSNLFAAVKFYQAAQAKKIKPIIGAEIYVHNDLKPKEPFRLVLLIQNHHGYQNLTRLISKAHIEGQSLLGKPIAQREWIKEYAEGLIALSAAIDGDIGQALMNDHPEQAKILLQDWLTIFPDRFYLEIQRIGRPREEDYIQQVIPLALATHTPVVATNNVRFLQEDDFEAHEARVCINQGYVLADNKRPKLYTNQQRLRSAKEMEALFKDIPEALENSVEIAKRCNLHLTLGKSYLPNFPTPANTTIEDFLREKSHQGLEQRLSRIIKDNQDNATRQTYEQRLTTELDVILRMGFAGYFLIVADFIEWAKNNRVPVGPGRGSGAGSLVAYALGITDLDPLQYELLFERFLNPERISMPDFDIDFCMEGRDRVIQYVEQKYGRASVCQIITFGTMAARAVVRDVGRVLAYPYGFVDKIAKLIPFELGITLKAALEKEEELQKRYDEEEEVKLLLDLAQKLEGVARNAGKHAGGVVIAPSLLTDFTPLYCEPDGAHIVTQFDKDDVEAVGLVKFDFLGLRTLTIIDWAIEIINQQRQQQQLDPIDITLIPTDDVKSYDLLKACQTTAVFQLESRGMKDLIKRLQPDCFEEIIALVALFRPGPLQSGMVDDFINRKHGRATIEYPHPDIASVLQPTYGVILYQEQVMQIAQTLAGFTLGAADLLRRAMGKKKAEEMAQQRTFFTQGAVARGVDKETATHIFDLMEKFAGYGFNKSHSAAYALLAYQTAWLKAHYPAAFMAAVLSSDMEHTEKVVTLIDECRIMNLTVTPPSIDRSHYRFTVDDDQTIIYGLGAIKGVGLAAIESILQARETGKPFTSLFDFCQRIDTRKVNRRTLEGLIRAGSMDQWGIARHNLLASLDKAIKTAEQVLQNEQQGQMDLFGGQIHSDNAQPTNEYITSDKPWTEQERLRYEKEALGFYLSGHPLQLYQQEITQLASIKIAEINLEKTQNFTIVGIIKAVRKMITKRGERMAFITIEDSSGSMEMAVFSECFNACQEYLMVDEIVVISTEISIDKYSGNYRVNTKQIQSLAHTRLTRAKSLVLSPRSEILNDAVLTQLGDLLSPFKNGSCPVYLHFQDTAANALIQFGANWKIKPTEDLLQQLYLLFGVEQVKLKYG